MADAPTTHAAEPPQAVVGRHVPAKAPPPAPDNAAGAVPEIGGRKDGTDPTRYGDWEKNGRCIDF